VALQRVPIRESTAEPVAERESHQHGGNRVRPHGRRRPEVRGKQARGGDLAPQRRRADDEDDNRERRVRDPPQ
jgi:hypothetical protein